MYQTLRYIGVFLHIPICIIRISQIGSPQIILPVSSIFLIEGNGDL